MTPAQRRRGEPFTVLGVIVAGWIGARVAFAGAGFSPQAVPPPAIVSASTPDEAALSFLPPPATSPHRGSAQPSRETPRRRIAASAITLAAGRSLPTKGIAQSVPWLAGSAPTEDVPPAPTAFEPPARLQTVPDRRWSADAWVLVRKSGGSGLGPGLAPSTYGASQAGAVLRYRLAPGDNHRPTAYLRVSRSLDRPVQTEAAAGLSARPFPRMPMVAAGELRLFRDAFGTRLRPVAMAITEFSPIGLPHGLRAEAYAQGGYAGGKDATAFVDGHLRLDRAVVQAGTAELRLGAGAWGGAQEGAARVDIGPSLIGSAPLGGGMFARASLDWRFRVGGDAVPGSGPALTLSAGF